MKSAIAYFGRIRIAAVVLVAVAAFVGAAQSASAPTLYTTGFELPTFHVGNVLMGLDGWQAPTTLPSFLNPYAATISNDTATSGHQSVEVRGGDLTSDFTDLAPYDAVGSYRHPLGYTMTHALPVAQVEADLFLDTDKQMTPGEFFSLTIAGKAGSGESLGEVGLSSQGIFEAFAFNSGPGALPTFTRHIEFNEWYHITMQFDYKHQTTSYFLNDHYIGTVAWTSTPNNVVSRASMVVYARPDGDASGGPGSHRKNYTARFDNFRVSVKED